VTRRGRIIPFPGPDRRRRARPAPPAERGLVEIHRSDQAEALVVKSLLESAGIPTVLRTRLLQSVHPFSVGSQGEVVVLVPEAEAARGRRLLARVAPDRPDGG
jgi:hypothetical protein